jgi:hypothetical protein
VKLSLLFASDVSREGLAGCAAHQYLCVAFGEEARYVQGRKFADIFFDERTLIILLVWVTALRIYVYAGIDWNSFLQQSVTQSSYAAKDVNCGKAEDGISIDAQCWLRIFFRRNALPSTLSRSGSLLVLHPQTVITVQPRLRRARRTRSSRFLLARSFSNQNFLLVDGNLERWQPLCPCQKHPLTRIATLSFGIIISGVPGNSRTCRRNRIACRRRKLSTSFSGSVFEPFTRLISQLRFCFESVSAISASAISWPVKWPPAPRFVNNKASRVRRLGVRRGYSSRATKFSAGTGSSL